MFQIKICIQNGTKLTINFVPFMRMTGIEPARLLTIEPKSIASATSAISAY